MTTVLMLLLTIPATTLCTLQLRDRWKSRKDKRQAIQISAGTTTMQNTSNSRKKTSQVLFAMEAFLYLFSMFATGWLLWLFVSTPKSDSRHFFILLSLLIVIALGPRTAPRD